MNKHTIWLNVLLIMLSINTAFATQWQLDNDNSQLNFISTKKTHVSEIHQFKRLDGTIDDSGNVIITIDLASIDTKIAIRDERMTTFLFDVASYPTAVLKATIDPETIDAIAEGASSELTVDATLELHGQSVPLTLDVVVTRLVGAKLSVVSVKPVLLNVADFSLVAGVEKLRELANLPSISHTVPVSFYLNFGLK
ncbi:MAG: YceI family protein [Gammaproteobacteria bacterium]|nr:YceI family protein [Gammaproteobacteria bacterium]